MELEQEEKKIVKLVGGGEGGGGAGLRRMGWEDSKMDTQLESVPGD